MNTIQNRTKIRFFRKILLSGVVGFLLGFGFPFDVSAQTPITIDWKTDLKFGKASSSVDGTGSIIIDAVANTRIVTGEAFDFGGTWKRGKFQIFGEPKAFVNVYLPTTVTFTSSNGSYTLTMSNLTMSRTNPFKLSKNGKKTVYIGGTLGIGVNQKDKTYKAIDFPFTVEYN